MSRKYYSSRTNPKELTIEELYFKLQNLFFFFQKKDYFQNKIGITSYNLPEQAIYEVALLLNFELFPINKWNPKNITEDNIFDSIEFLYDRVSRPGEKEYYENETGFQYLDYASYDDEVGKKEFREKANAFLVDYKEGYELNQDGYIQAKGNRGLQYIIDAEILPYDEINVDNKVRDAIKKWRDRKLSLSERREAIRDLADVFEWLKKTKKLELVLDKKDDNALFDIANNFAIRHHNPKQKSNYDINIWYSWMFHFYLATYHAVVRLLINKEQDDIMKKI